MYSSLFNVVVLEKDQTCTDNVVAHLGLLETCGVLTNFSPNPEQIKALKSVYPPLNVATLFSKSERENTPPLDLIRKQILHYVDTYGLGKLDFLTITNQEGQKTGIRFVRGISVQQLGDLVRKQIYTNAPIKDPEELKALIDRYHIDFDINQVAVNEIRIMLYDRYANKRNFHLKSGDDVVRYMVYQVTERSEIIKSPELITAIKDANIRISKKLLAKYRIELAQVFNRHKRLIIAFKTDANKTEINRISRSSKTRHIPLFEPAKKTVVSAYMRGKLSTAELTGILQSCTMRDLFKLLNLLEFKKSQLSMDVFTIRNGKLFPAQDRPIYANEEIEALQDALYKQLAGRLRPHLAGKKILLDPDVDYGLPTSQKQLIGNLPFGTSISMGPQFSVGIHWKNAWGARDLDLSVIDPYGNRIGWGDYSGYTDQDILFSGDMTDAPDGAMEFFTVKDSTKGQQFGLTTNIFSGRIGTRMEIVVGTSSSKNWIDDIKIREKMTLSSHAMITGIVNANRFIVFAGRSGEDRISSGQDSVFFTKGYNGHVTLMVLFERIGIGFDFQQDTTVQYDHDLSYSGFSIDKLEKLLNI